MIKNLLKNWSIVCLVIFGGIVIANNVNSQEINSNSKFQSSPTLTFKYWFEQERLYLYYLHIDNKLTSFFLAIHVVIEKHLKNTVVSFMKNIQIFVCKVQIMIRQVNIEI
jgi:hypothetical protein